MTLEERLQTIIGQLVMENAVLAVKLEAALAPKPAAPEPEDGSGR